MSLPSAQTLLSAVSLATLGLLGAGMLFWPIPAANATAMTFVLGALAGALTGGTLQKPPSPQP